MDRNVLFQIDEAERELQ